MRVIASVPVRVHNDDVGSGLFPGDGVVLLRRGTHGEEVPIHSTRMLVYVCGASEGTTCP